MIGNNFNESTVIHTAKLYMGFASKINRHNTAFLKLQGLFLQSCGLNEVGLEALYKIGESIYPRHLLDIKSRLAVKDEENIKEVAKYCSIAIVLDNLDRQVKKVLQHKTLPMLLCRDMPQVISDLGTQKKTLEESLLNFEPNFFYLDASSNSNEKEAFLKVNTLSVIAIESIIIIIIVRNCRQQYDDYELSLWS